MISCTDVATYEDHIIYFQVFGIRMKFGAEPELTITMLNSVVHKNSKSFYILIYFHKEFQIEFFISTTEL